MEFNQPSTPKVRRSQREISRQLRKTKMCSYYLRGSCPFEDECAFAHTLSELKVQPNLYKTRMCKFWMKGTCADAKCSFAHGMDELVPSELQHLAEVSFSDGRPHHPVQNPDASRLPPPPQAWLKSNQLKANSMEAPVSKDLMLSAFCAQAQAIAEVRAQGPRQERLTSEVEVLAQHLHELATRCNHLMHTLAQPAKLEPRLDRSSMTTFPPAATNLKSMDVKWNQSLKLISPPPGLDEIQPRSHWFF